MPSMIQRNFAAGEVAPSVFGRTDQTKYQSGLARCRNFMVLRHGGIANRPGLQYITEQADSSARGRLWRFIFNADQTYVLLFENFKIRFIRNGALITVSGLSAYNGATAYVKGDLVVYSGTNYYAKAGSTGAQPDINPATWYAMPADGTYEIQTSYATADLPDLYFSQSADVITINHPNYDTQELSRFDHTNWQLSTVSFTPSIAAPGSLSVSGTAGAAAVWVATAVKALTLEESLPSGTAGANSAPTSGAPRTLTIGAVSGATEYNVYRSDNSRFGYVGSTTSTTFVDTGFTPDYTATPPSNPVPLTGSGNRPASSGYLQQRKCYGGSDNAPEDIYASKAGQYKNFTRTSPLQDDDACLWTPSSSEVNRIRHFIEVSENWVLTQGAEWILFGDGSGSLTPSTPGMKKQSSHGSATIQPVIIGNSFLFVQSRGSIVRDIKYEANSNGYAGRDLTVFSSHLFDKYTIARWSYAQIPNSIVWVARSDGNFLGLTYLRDHEVWGWHDHDTKGAVEDTVTVPEGNEDRTYFLVRRTIDGNDVRYVERMASRQVTDIAVDATFMDSFLSYDGRHTGSTLMTLSGGTDWTFDEDLTLTASGSTFSAGDVGKMIVLKIETLSWTPEGGYATAVEKLRCLITAYTSATVVTVNAEKTVPAAFRSVAVSVWATAVVNVSGLDHLEGETVSILADGNVVTNGIDTPLTTVSGGTLDTDLPTHAEIIHVGIPYVSDAQTLDIDVLGQETLADKQKQVSSVTALVESSRGIWAGEPDESGYMNPDNLYELAQRAPEHEYEMITGVTGKVEIGITSSWNLGGRVHIRQRDPLPLTVLAIIPSMSFGG